MSDEVQLFRRVIYNYLKAKIYRPTSRLPLRTTAGRQICFDVCQNVIDAKDMLDLNSTAVVHPWHILHILFDAAVILLDACWQYRSQPLMRPAASHVLLVVIPRCLEMIDEIGRWWGRANLCINCLRPMLEEVNRPYNDPYLKYPGSLSASDAATTENLESLMFADRIRYDLSSEDTFFEPDSQFFDDAIYNWDFQDMQLGIY